MDFKIYTNRWGRFDYYQFQRTSTGWRSLFMGEEGNLEPNGEPLLTGKAHQNFLPLS